jgi:membrane protease YdiL (CAAX protease family)
MHKVERRALPLRIAREAGSKGAKEFLGRALDYRRVRGAGWALAALLLMPMVFVLEYGLLHLSSAVLPDLQFFSAAKIAAFFLMFFIGAVGDELGWQGYAFAGLKNSGSALRSGRCGI